MAKRWTLCVFMILSQYAYVETSNCKILDLIDKCKYTIVCEGHAGSTLNPNCDHEPYVTFQVTNSRADVLSKSFFGATNFDSRVRVITATNNSWTTIATNTFSYYTKVLQVNLSGNGIREVQNEAFKNLFTMNVLNLSYNSIESLYSHSLLTAETSVSYVERLDLSNNLLRNVASDAFNECPNVRELYLQNNNIAYLEDSVFGNLKNLTILNLRNNKLTALNMTLINLKQLKDLDLAYNAIDKLQGFEINRLVSLKRVNMSNNMIKTIESNCFNQAFNLESLDLRNNNITSPIVNIMFINNGKLNYLNFYKNNITKIQENAFQHNNLLYLDLEKNFVSGEITESTFAGLQKIKNLNLYNQNITLIKAKAFIEMTSLTKLNMSDNNIDVIDQSGFENTSSLLVLDLSRNNIKNLNFLKKTLTNLTEIYLNNNKITLIPGYAFVNQTLLKKLDISNNIIITIEQYALPLNSLQFLNISGNPVAGSVKSNVLSPAQYLRFLDLSNLNITKIEDMAFVDLPLLARLNLSNNAIEYISEKNFLNLDNMFSLDLSYNRLSKLHLNGTFMKSLSALYLNNNNLQDIFGAIPNTTAIMYLDISHNNISELTGAAFQNLKNLRVLLASNNKLENINNPQINVLDKLQDLNLSSNKISTIDLKFFKNLVWLDISNNILKIINSTFLQNSNKLQVLNICNNNITEIPPGVFQSAKSLTILNISSNDIYNLRYGSLRGLHNTKVIDLSRNNIMDVDVDVFHECEQLIRLIIDYNHIKHLDVEQLTKVVPTLISLSIGGNPLDCKQVVRSIRNINKTAVRSVEITSIHKIFHEDNVYGIRCGNVDVNDTSASTETSNPSEEATYPWALIAWCSVLTVFFVLLTAAFVYWKLLYKSVGMYAQTRMQFRQSVELSESEVESDLLN